MIRHRCALVFCFVLLLAASGFPGHALGQRRSRTAAVPAVPSPQSVLGFNPGDDRTIADWEQITDYFAKLDKSSDRVTVQKIGETTLGKPMIAAIISAPENLRALQKYQDIQRKLADPRLVANAAERDQLVRDGKVVVAISCSIHSSEIVASQMSMQLAYALASLSDPDTHEILQNTILLLIPSSNPDGVDIVANWYRRTLGTPFEGKDPPEIYHHYAGHDDNRDWFMLNLKESRAITHFFWKEWFPEIVYDVHQQGSNGSRFFVPPFYDPPNPEIDPWLLRQVGLIGHRMAADVTAAGYRGVLTNALYDTWWHGGFRTAPYFHNSIGILTEAASARLMTPSTVMSDQLARTGTRGMRNALEATTNFPDPWPGGQWRPRDIMGMEQIASRSLLQLAARYRGDYLRGFYAMGGKSLNPDPAPNRPIAYLIPAGQGGDEAVATFIGTLVAQGIEVQRLDKELHAAYGPEELQRTNSAAEKLGTYRVIVAQSVGMHEVPAGSYVILLRQPQRHNITSLFAPQIYPNRVNALGEAERPYDVTGWTLPMQMGVETAAVMNVAEPQSDWRLTPVKEENDVRRDFGLALRQEKGSPLHNPLTPSARIGIYRSAVGNIDEGWTRFVFDSFNVPYKSLADAEIKQGNLASAYQAIILPSQRQRDLIEGLAAGSYPAELTGGLTEAGVNNLRRFVEDGGTLICFDAACELPIKQFNLPLRNALENSRSSDFYCPGSIVRLEVDRTQPIARGLPAVTDAYFINSSAFEATDAKVHVVARYAKENVLQSGWLLGEDKLRGRIALAEVSLGRGHVVLFGFRPQHRGQTWATFPFIWNALSLPAN